jgi:putative selenium metabolism hydrolase
MLKDQIRKSIEARKSDLVSFLQDLIRYKSFCGHEREAIRRVRMEMERLNYDEIYKSAMGSLIGRIGNGSKKIIYDAHVDTVSPGNIDLWERAPFDGIVENDIVYGLGACDTKGSLASMIYAGAIIKELKPDDFTLYVIATVMEEDCEGMADKFIFDNNEIGIPDIIVIGEPSSLRIAGGSKGRVELSVKTKGISSHASSPHLGVNAIYKMAGIITELEKSSLNLTKHPVMGKGEMAVTEINSISSSRNAVPSECEIVIDRRLVMGDDIQDIINSIKAMDSFKDASLNIEIYNSKSYTGLDVVKEKLFPPWLLDKDDKILEIACNTFKSVLEREPEIFTWDFCTNANYTAGEANLPTFGFGPGEERFAHTVEEHVKISDLMDAVSFYVGFPYVYTGKSII